MAPLNVSLGENILWVSTHCQEPYACSILSLNVFSLLGKHRLKASWKPCLPALSENTAWFSWSESSLALPRLLGPPLLPSPRGRREQRVTSFTRKLRGGGFRWSPGSVRVEVTKRSGWRAAFQRANTGWNGLFLFHPRGSCPPKCITSNISGCLDDIQTHIYCVLSSGQTWPT